MHMLLSCKAITVRKGELVPSRRFRDAMTESAFFDPEGFRTIQGWRMLLCFFDARLAALSDEEVEGCMAVFAHFLVKH